MLWVDYLTSESSNFPVMYVVPVILAAWYSGMWAALGLAVAVPVFRLMFLVAPNSSPGDMAGLAAATALRGVVIIFLALWFARLAEFERSLE